MLSVDLPPPLMYHTIAIPQASKSSTTEAPSLGWDTHKVGLRLKLPRVALRSMRLGPCLGSEALLL